MYAGTGPGLQCTGTAKQPPLDHLSVTTESSKSGPRLRRPAASRRRACRPSRSKLLGTSLGGVMTQRRTQRARQISSRNAREGGEFDGRDVGDRRGPERVGMRVHTSSTHTNYVRDLPTRAGAHLDEVWTCTFGPNCTSEVRARSAVRGCPMSKSGMRQPKPRLRQPSVMV